jgi:hypothetical protein
MITFDPAHISAFQSPLSGYWTAFVDRRRARQMVAAASRRTCADLSTSRCSRKVDDTGPPVTARVVAHVLKSDAPCAIDMDDWNTMFGAVNERLATLCGDAASTPSYNVSVSQGAHQLRLDVLDCVGALEGLRKAVTHASMQATQQAPGDHHDH